MAESRARESFFASHRDLLRSIVEIDPCTVVPKGNSIAPDDHGRPPHVADGAVLCVLSSCAAPVAAGPSVRLKPHYDVSRRELSLAGVVLKRFRKPAANQEAILKTFEEESELNGGFWPPKIDDPISGETPDPIKRLHSALDALNAAIKESAALAAASQYVEFFTDGTGQGVRWRIVAVAASVAQAS